METLLYRLGGVTIMSKGASDIATNGEHGILPHLSSSDHHY
jgi:hypothetical protein